MFTGIVEETGSIRSLQLSGSSGKIAIRAKKVLGGTRIGDSIAVNGVCLTVVSLEKDGFTADVMAETVRRTNLGDTKIGEKVTVVKLTGEGAVKRRIMDMGITKGVEIFVRKVAPLGDPMELNVRGYELSVRKGDAEMIEVL